MVGKHHAFCLAVGLLCGSFLKSNAASSVGINLKVDVNGKTVIDRSIPNGKLYYTTYFLIYMIKFLFSQIR